jgi:cytochrome d ubiquinol oxidase subunit I
VMAQSWWIGFVAVIAGWVVTESGRQPWIVQDIMRTIEATSPVLAGAIAATLGLFVLVYGIVFSFGIYYINRLIANGLQVSAVEPQPQMGSPIAAASAAGREALRGG